MKKLESIVKALENITVEQLEAIVNCENVAVEDLTENEKFAVLVFAELEKALKTKDSFLTLDCNYEQSKFHDSEQYKVDYFRLVSNDTKNATMIQFYASANAKKQTCKFLLCTSCAKCNREQFEALEDSLKFTVKRDKKTNRAKTSQRSSVEYSEVVDIVKAVCSVLANSSKQKEAEKTSEQ